MTVSLRTRFLICAAILLPGARAHAADPPDAAAEAWLAYDAANTGAANTGAAPAAAATVQTVAFRPLARSADILQTGIASWYGRAWKGRRTASGTRFNPEEMTAASHTLPLGTRVLVTLEGTARSVLVTITDRQGTARRIIDLSLAAAREIGMVGMGTARVTLRRA